LLVSKPALDSAEGHRLVSLQDTPGGLSETSVPLWRPRAPAAPAPAASAPAG
jgi:hypothetical protein